MSDSVPPSDRATAFVLLAAGRGQRFGAGKLLADLCGRPLWRWALDNARGAGFDDLHVVSNDPRIAADCEMLNVVCHPNPDADDGMASSIAVASQATRSAPRTVIALADMPFVTPEHFKRLALAKRVAFTRYPAARRGVPAAFGREDFSRLLTLEGDRGAASLFWPDAVDFDPADPEDCFDVDTPKALDQARAIAIKRWPGACR
ncbi:nucleotidyltransferase family protein [Tsuneonella sp. HG094]